MALMLTEREQAALAEYQSRLLARFPQRTRRIMLFGSKARGDAGPESDLDVLVGLGDGVKSQDGFYPLGLTDPAWREIVGMAFDLLMKYGVDILPTVISEDEFEQRPPLVQIIVFLACDDRLIAQTKRLRLPLVAMNPVDYIRQEVR